MTSKVEVSKELLKVFSRLYLPEMRALCSTISDLENYAEEELDFELQVDFSFYSSFYPGPKSKQKEAFEQVIRRLFFAIDDFVIDYPFTGKEAITVKEDAYKRLFFPGSLVSRQGSLFLLPTFNIERYYSRKNHIHRLRYSTEETDIFSPFSFESLSLRSELLYRIYIFILWNLLEVRSKEAFRYIFYFKREYLLSFIGFKGLDDKNSSNLRKYIDRVLEKIELWHGVKYSLRVREDIFFFKKEL